MLKLVENYGLKNWKLQCVTGTKTNTVQIHRITGAYTVSSYILYKYHMGLTWDCIRYILLAINNYNKNNYRGSLIQHHAGIQCVAVETCFIPIASLLTCQETTLNAHCYICTC